MLARVLARYKRKQKKKLWWRRKKHRTEVELPVGRGRRRTTSTGYERRQVFKDSEVGASDAPPAPRFSVLDIQVDEEEDGLEAALAAAAS